MNTKYTFASDNVAGLTPEALAALQVANSGCNPAYGEDAYNRSLQSALHAFFVEALTGYPVFNGTAANALSLASLVKPYEAVACHKHAHADLDECNAPEFFTGGAKLVPIDGDRGKVCPEALKRKLMDRDDVHFPKIRALSLTFSSEVGTVYTLRELESLGEVCAEHGVSVHLDGARFFNGLASLGCAPAEVIEACDASALSLGLVKAGFSIGEVVVFFDSKKAEGFQYRRKQAGQLASKMRYIVAPALKAFDGLALESAAHANACAKILVDAFSARGIEPVFPVEANAVFVRMPDATAHALRQKGWVFYDFVENTHRFVCHWATSQADIDRLIVDLDAVL